MNRAPLSLRFAMALLAGLAITIPPIGLPTADATNSQARRAAATVYQTLRNRGFQVRDTFQLGLLPRRGRHTVRTTLTRGITYNFVAAGCNDAYDIDLHIYDENWNLVARDQATAASAVVAVNPRWTGTFYVVVEMFNSRSDGAHWFLQTAYR